MRRLWFYPIRLLPWAMRRQELRKLAPYLRGRGADVGCGRRKASREALGIDLFPYPAVDLVADAAALPLRAACLDYICSVHSLEHCPRPEAALREWLRVLRPGGVICLVLPDVRYTGHTNTDRTAHWNEWAAPAFLAWLNEVGLADRLEAAGEACPRWSFYCLLRKPTAPAEAGPVRAC